MEILFYRLPFCILYIFHLIYRDKDLLLNIIEWNSTFHIQISNCILCWRFSFQIKGAFFSPDEDRKSETVVYSYHLHSTVIYRCYFNLHRAIDRCYDAPNCFCLSTELVQGNLLKIWPNLARSDYPRCFDGFTSS